MTFATLNHRRVAVLVWTVNGVLLAAGGHPGATLVAMLLATSALAVPIWEAT